MSINVMPARLAHGLNSQNAIHCTLAAHGSLSAYRNATAKAAKAEKAKKAAKAPKAPKAEKKAPARLGAPQAVAGKGKYAGLRLYPLVSANPRQAGSFGAASFAIISTTPGITYEAYINLGGRNKDLAWDVAHGFTEAR